MSRTRRSFIKQKDRFSNSHLAIYLIIFAAVGGVVLYLSFASPNPNLPGDLNGDNKVDGADLSFLAANFKTNSAAADINGDGIVDIGDLSILLSHYGQSLSATINVPATTTAHTIDGNLNEADWSITTPVTKCVLGTCNNTASFGTLWDTTYLYVGVKVTDSSLKNDSTNCWDDDSVEVYVDPTNAGGTTYTSGDRQIVQRYNDSSLCAGVGTNTGVLHAWAAISGGYSVEIAIPWSLLGTTASSGKAIGLDVGINDDDDGTARDSQLMYNGTANNSSNPSGFGHATLSGNPISPPPPPPPPPSACSGTGNGKVGATRGGLMGFSNGYRYGQLSSTDRDRYFSVMADEGVKWTRMDMEGNNMTQWQDFVSRASAHGICVFGNIDSTSWSDPPDHQAYANNAANEVSQLKGSVHVWEIWNEENTSGFWPSGDFNSYADLLHKTYLAIKAVDPNTIIMPGGPAPCGDGTQACNPINFYKTIYTWNKNQGRQGSSQLFDAATVHPYGYPWDPLAAANWGQSWNAYYQTYLLHQVMLDPNYGGPTNDGAKKIWGTEGGFPSGCPSGITNLDTCISLATAASWVQPLMDNWMNNWGSFTGPFMWYEVQNQPDRSSDREGYFGFIDASWNPKQNQYDNLKAYSALP